MKDTAQNNSEGNLSITNEIKTLFNKGLNTEQIKTELKNKGIEKDNHYIRSITYRLRVREGLITPKTEQTTHTTEQAISIKVFENDNKDLMLYIKSNKAFEEHLKNTKELRHTENLWGLGENGDYYHLRLDNDVNLDDINTSIFKGYSKIGLNRAILRCKGISEGLTFNLGNFGLISEESLKTIIKNFIKVYSEFYNKEILNKKIEINSEVLIEND